MENCCTYPETEERYRYLRKERRKLSEEINSWKYILPVNSIEIEICITKFMLPQEQRHTLLNLSFYNF